METAALQQNIATALFDGFPDPVVVVDAAKVILSANPAACEQFGYGTDDLQHRPVRVLYASDEDYDRCLGARATVLADTAAVDLQINFLRCDGSVFTGRLRSTPFKDADGKPAGLIGIIHDMSDFLAVDTERRRTRDMLDTALEAIPEGFAVFDRDGRLMLFNEAYRSFCGPTGETLRIGMSVDEIMMSIFESGHYPDAPPGSPKSVAWMESRLNDFRVPDGRGVVFRYGKGRWLRAENIRTSDGNTVALRIDVTDLKETELALNRQRLEILTLVRNLPDFVTRISKDKRFTYVNEHYADFVGVTARRLIGKPFLDFVPHSDHARVIATLDSLSPERPILTAEQSRVGPDGREIWIHWSNMAIYDGQQLVEYVTVGRDITKLKQQQDRIERQRIELERKNEALSQFTGTVSHDLKAPLRHISMFSEMINDDIGTGRMEDIPVYAGHLRHGARRMERLISSLLDYSQIAYDINTWKPIELRGVVEDAIQTLGVHIGEADAAIEIGPLPVVSGDRELLRRLAENLIGNAVKYRREGERVVVRVYGEETDERATLIVEDNGIGIDPRFARKIFDVFQRLHKDELVYPGTGIGLSLAKRIVESHGGTIELDTTHSRGARFVMRFPRTMPGSRERRTQ